MKCFVFAIIDFIKVIRVLTCAMTAKVVLVLFLVISVVAAQERGFWLDNAALFSGKRDEFPVENDNMEVIPETEGSGLVEKDDILKELSKRWKLK